MFPVKILIKRAERKSTIWRKGDELLFDRSVNWQNLFDNISINHTSITGKINFKCSLF